MTEIQTIVGQIVALPDRPLVIVDRDLAALYEQPTGEINRTVVLHQASFPPEVVFRLTRQEAQRPEIGWTRGHLPHVFTREGAYALALILNAPTAIAISVQVLRAFWSYESAGGALSGLLTKLSDRLAAIEKACGVLMQPRSGNHVSYRSRPNGLRFPEVQALLERMLREGYSARQMLQAIKEAWPDDPARLVGPAAIGRFCKGIADGRIIVARPDHGPK